VIKKEFTQCLNVPAKSFSVKLVPDEIDYLVFTHLTKCSFKG